MRLPPLFCASILALTFWFAPATRAEDAPKTDIDINRAREIYERQQKGEKISAEDQAYLEKVKAARERGETPAAAGKPAVAGIDMERAKALHQREQNGEKLSAEDQDYLDKARGAAKGGSRPQAQPDASGIDWEKAKGLYQREQSGEKLSPEEQAYLDKAKAARERGETPAATGKPAVAGIDMERAKALHQRQQNGEKLSAEDQDYLDKARGAAKGGARPQAQPDASGIDWEKAKGLYQREQSGEKLSPEEQAYLDKAKAARGAGRNPQTRPAGGQGGQPNLAGFDMERAKALHQREQNGEKLSPEDQDYLDKVKAAIRGGARPDGERPNKPGKQGDNTPARTGKSSVDITPLNDLAGGKYKDQDGGLYGNGQNTPPADQLKLAHAAAAAIKPLDDKGAASPMGKIVLLTIGMSNTTMESSSFKKLADADARKAADVVIVDGAQGGKDAAAWVNAPSNERVWETADARLTAAGVSPRQVQVLWIKQALMGPARHGEFPKHAEDLKADIEQILVLAKQRYPNVKLAYLSSRIYAGFATTELNPEPYSYESAFSVRWVIQDQMKAGTTINADPAKGDVLAPVALWGPYLWVDGEKGRKTDSVIFERKDLAGDGTHPSESGRQKVAEMLLNFFTTDETAKAWFVKK